MTRQKPWDQYEAVILLEATVRVHEGLIDRKKAIIDVSKALRCKAQHEGFEIDDVFRNEAGITFQMYSMESAYLGYIVREKPATRLFAEVAHMRTANRAQYDILVKEAITMSTAVDNRSEYQEWLMSTGMKNTAARNYGNWLNNIDAYALEHDYSEKSIYDCSVEELTSLYEKLSQDKELVSNHRDFMVSFRKYVYYRSDGTIQFGRSRSTPIGVASSKRYEYQEWLVKSGMQENAARNYGNWLNNIDMYALEHGFSNRSVYEYENPEELAELYEVLSEDDDLSANHRDYLTSFRRFVFYRSDGAIEFGRRKKLFSAEKVVEESEIAFKIEMSDEETERYSMILGKYFEEGLAPNAIRLDKFRMQYEDVFGVALTDNDDFLIDQLKVAGAFIDGRIYPKKNIAENELLGQIRKEICAVLSGGASCVYISSVMQRWRQPLADQLNVYNETALRDLIISADMSDVFATDAVFKMTRNKVYPELDVLEYMKRCHAPVAYKQLEDCFWYIPLDVIKHALVTTPSLVQVDVETYMYAPNFPASAGELQNLIKVMKARISEKGFLVSQDIAALIHEKCHTVAINTEGYKDWAYRNILKYVLRDYFEFGGSVVSEKGKKLEMWQVYRSFCRDYEKLTFEELKQFSSEVGVQIYWEDVLQEMVRINEKELVRRDLVHFDTDAIDRVLDEFCQGDYIPIKQVGLFLHFPTFEYPWNDFVLESYLSCSRRFSLFHVSYSENKICGVVVRKNSGFEDYRQVIVDMLARCNEWADEKSALALIVEKGYQARKRWTGFDKVVQEALVRREKILMERK